MHRREVLAVLAAGAGVSSEMLAWGRQLHAQLRAGIPPVTLGPNQRATITIVAEHIIPKSDTPGATDAGVTSFIDHMLAEWYEADERNRVLAGLAALDVRGREQGAGDFLHLTEARQVALLTTLDGEAVSSDHWFAIFKFLTVWGYCTSEVAMRDSLGAYPPPMRYEACAPYRPRVGDP